MTDAQSVHWAMLFLSGQDLPEGPQAANALRTILEEALEAIPDYSDGRNDQLCDDIMTALDGESPEDR